MDFGECLKMLKEGKRMARKGWNGKGMYIYLVKGRFIRAKDWTGNPDVLRKIVINGVEERGVELNGHIDMKTADGSICVGWLASQTDMLADDWVTVE